MKIDVESRSEARAFTLVEMLVVIGIISLLIGLLGPAINGLKSSSDFTAGSYDVAGALETARGYALANNTYTWVGFFEEDASRPQTAGIGRVIISTVAANDGVQGFDPSASVSATNKLDPGHLSQIGNLVKISNTHLAAFVDGAGAGATFDLRPKVGKGPYPDSDGNNARIGDNDPSTPTDFVFRFPLNSTQPQYTFSKIIQFDPQGNSRVNSTLKIKPVVEIGLRPTRGNILQPQNPNVLAIQLSGIGGSVKIFRK